MDQGFDGWVRQRLHPENTDIPDIASHIDPNCFGPETDWALPGAVDDLFSWLTSNQDVSMVEPNAIDTGHVLLQPDTAAESGPAAPAAAAGFLPGAAQHQQVSAWQLAYLQQAVQQQPGENQPADVVAQQQMLLSSGIPPGFQGYPEMAAETAPAAAAAAAACPMDFIAQQQQGVAAPWAWLGNPNLHAAAAHGDPGGGAGAVTVTTAIQALQRCDSNSNPRSSRSTSSGSMKQRGTSRAAVSKVPGQAKKPRRITEAQRAAHRRFRVRRKEQVSSMVAEVAAKQAQLELLSAEHEALTAKARTLDRLVASAGDSMLLLQSMEKLSLEQTQQQAPQLQQPQLPPAEQNTGSCSSSSSPGGAAGPLLAEPPAQQQLQQQSLEPGETTNTSPAAHQAASAAAGSIIYESSSAGAAAADGDVPPGVAARILPRAVDVSRSCGNNDGSSASAPPTPTAASLSLERLEAAVRAALGRPAPPPQQQQQQQQVLQELQLQRQRIQLQLLGLPESQSLLLHSALPSLQGLLKSLVNEVMQLVLQINMEQGQAAPAATAAGLGRGAAAGLAAAGAGEGGRNASAAAARLQSIRQQVFTEFRAFAATNRISVYLLNTLNFETGVMGVRPPPGHWRSGAQLMLQRLEPSTLQDVVMGHKLFMQALTKVSQERRVLLRQLHTTLRDTTSSSNCRYTNDSLYSNNLGPRSTSALLLNAIDSNLRKEHVLEGVFHWTLNKLLPPLLTSELVVHSYPYITDLHAIVAELLHMLPPSQQQCIAAAAAGDGSQPQQPQLAMLAPTEQQQQQQQQQIGGVNARQHLQQTQYQASSEQLLLQEQLYQQQQQQQQQQGLGVRSHHQVPPDLPQVLQPLSLAYLSTPCG